MVVVDRLEVLPEKRGVVASGRMTDRGGSRRVVDGKVLSSVLRICRPGHAGKAGGSDVLAREFG